jgi:hypothetical protein
MIRSIVASLLSLVIGYVLISPVRAMPPFKVAFDNKYVKESDSEDFKKLAKKESCNVCHLKGKKKEKGADHLNSYGKELEKLIEGNANERLKKANSDGGASKKKAEQDTIVKELEKAFEEVAKMKSKSGDLFGDLIKSGKLPGAEP